ncbi:hypothetical protein [Asanoa hainanensis]|uniref:hypothetical protein n=1 Tax=Asanoa hainanensis TaxID=560556 RepID=UPI00117CB39E|nr:hypothetical protein [Asanoa hainanensis]
MFVKAFYVAANQVEFAVENSAGEKAVYIAPVIPPSSVQRATGTFRDPASLVDLTPTMVSALFEAQEPGSGKVVALIVHTVSRRAAAVGLFADATDARSWWRQSFNRLAKDADVLFVPVVVEGDA